MTLAQYYERFGSRITQDSERLFVDEFLYALLGDRIEEIEPQFPFIDSTGRCRRIDFAYKGANLRLAFEVNGETYHAEGVIAGGVFDDNHHHSGLGFLAPAVVHFGHAPGARAHRGVVLAAAYVAHPERFVNGPPQPADLPTAVWINPPVKQLARQDAPRTTIVVADDQRVVAIPCTK